MGVIPPSKYFNFCEIFLEKNQSDFFLMSCGTFTVMKKLTKWPPHSLIGSMRKQTGKTDIGIFSKQDLIGFWISFRLQQSSAALKVSCLDGEIFH